MLLKVALTFLITGPSSDLTVYLWSMQTSHSFFMVILHPVILCEMRFSVFLFRFVFLLFLEWDL